jgi:hypothetical protein
MASAATLTLTTAPLYSTQVPGKPWSVNVGFADSNYGEVVCLDFTRTTNIPASFEVMIKAPTTKWELEAAFLVSEMLSAPAGQIDDYQFAIWEIMNPWGTPFYSTLANSLVSQAQSQILTADMFADYRIFIPTQTCDQRFLGPGEPPPGEVPEPATLGLLGIGIGTVGILRRRG